MKLIQGVNAYAAPFLYVMPEVDAFYCVCKLMRWHCPLYMGTGDSATGTFPVGANTGRELYGQVLHKMDPKLSEHLSNSRLSPEVYATMNLNLSPVSEWLKLWDTALCLGIHLHLIFTVARVLLIRDKLFETSNPNDYLGHGKWPRLPAKSIINVGVLIIQSLPEDLYTRVLYHPFHSGAEEVDALHKFSTTVPNKSGRNMTV